MKKYIGTKQVEAEPMAMGEAYEKGLLQAGRVPSEAEKDKDGYHVRYKDGYESWSPTEPFEESYKLADTALDRMLIEGEELTVKLEKSFRLLSVQISLVVLTKLQRLCL